MFELRKDASRTKAPPYNLYTIVVSGIEQEAIRTRGVWNTITGAFVAYDQKVEDVFILLVCNVEGCHDFGKEFEISIWDLHDAEGVLACDGCGKFLDEAAQ
jgi:hypothetical protein